MIKDRLMIINSSFREWVIERQLRNVLIKHRR